MIYLNTISPERNCKRTEDLPIENFKLKNPDIRGFAVCQVLKSFSRSSADTIEKRFKAERPQLGI